MADIIVNGRRTYLDSKKITMKQVVEIAKGPTNRSDVFTVTYSGPRSGDGSRKSGELLPGQHVDLEDGMVFNAVITSGA